MNNKVQLQKMLLLMSLFALEQRLLASASPEKSGIEQGSALIIKDDRCAQIVGMLNAAVADGRTKFDGVGKSSTPGSFVDQSYAPLCHTAWAAVNKKEGIVVKDSGQKDGQMYVTVSTPVVRVAPLPTKAEGMLAHVYRMLGW